MMGFQWEDRIYVNLRLPFGLRSALFIFSSVADALLWIMRQSGVTWAIHYLDDFFTIGLPHSEECLHNITIMHTICDKAGMPIEHRKSEGPSTSLVFLGIEIDSVRGCCICLQKRENAISHWHISSCEQSSMSQQDFLTKVD